MVKINDNFVIDSDENQFILKEITTVQDTNSKNYGEKREIVLGYFGTLEHSLIGLEKILQRRAIKVKDYDIKSFIQEIRAIHDDIFKVLKEG